MKLKIAATALATLSAVLSGCMSSTKMASPAFTHMDLALSTHARGKDPGDRVEILIAPDAGEAAVAYLDLASQQLRPYTARSAIVMPSGAGFTLDDLKHEQILVRMNSEGSGSWSYGFDAILHFSDGSEALVSSGDQTVRYGRPGLTPLSLSMLASPSTVGSLEKFAFGMMSSRKLKATSDEQAEQASEPAPSTAQAAPQSLTPFAMAPGYTGPLNPSAATFTHMDLSLATHDNGKGPGTRLEISVLPEEGDTQAAYIDLPGQDFAPNTTVQELVPATGESFTLSDLKHQRIRLRVTPQGGATWTCSFDVVLHFTNGAEALLSSGDLRLGQYATVADVPLSLATVASANRVGRIERYMFGLLSRGGGPKPVQSANAAPEAAPVYKNSKEFTQMDVELSTRGRGKPADARLEILIVPREGDPAVAYLDVPGQDLAPGSKVTEIVPPAGTGFLLGNLKHEQILVRISSARFVTWSYSFDVTLHFADGTQALLGSGDQTLSSGNPQELLPLSEAAVASRSILGGVEKFGFGLLKH
jgi:hypothetical protein